MSEIQSIGADDLRPTFEITDYKPDGGFDVSGVAMLISALVLIGAVLGFAAHLVSQAFYLIILFPALIGAALGYVGKKMVLSGRVRNPIVGGLAGFLGGVFAMTMMHYFDYEQFKTMIAEMKPETRQMAETLAKLNPDQRKMVLRKDITQQQQDAIDKVIQAVSIHSFFDFMNAEARQGVEISSSHSMGKHDGMNLGFYGSYIYWLVEILIVAVITFAMIKQAAAEPFCIDCSDWKKPKVLGFFQERKIASVVAAMKSGDLAQIAAQQPSPNVTPLKLSAAACPHCAGKGDVDMKLEHVTYNKKGQAQFKTIAHNRYPVTALEAMRSLFAAPAPAVVDGAAPPTATPSDTSAPA